MRVACLLVACAGVVAGCGVPSYNFNPLDASADGAGTDSSASHDASRDAHDAHDAKHHDAPSGPCSSCVEAAPSGWSGPVALYDGEESKAPPCSGAYGVLAYKGNGALSAPAPTCSTCSCAATGSSSCGASVVNAGTGCGDPQCPGFALPLGACVSLASSGAACNGSTVAYDPQGPTGSPVGCSASGGALTAPPASFAAVARACAASSAGPGCGATEVCGATPPSDFNDGLCIEQSGDVACPGASIYSVPHVFYAGSADGRACSACQCTPPSCAGTVGFFTDGACSNGTGASGIPAFCFTPGAASGFAQYVPSSTSCTASGGAPSGTVTGTTPTTFCCTL